MLRNNLAINEKGFVFNPGTGDSFSTNSSAALILQWMKEGCSLQEIKQRLQDTYSMDSLILEKDLNDFMHTLDEYRLLQS